MLTSQWRLHMGAINVQIANKSPIRKMGLLIGFSGGRQTSTAGHWSDTGKHLYQNITFFQLISTLEHSHAHHC